MGSFRKPRPRFLSSPVLSDLPRFHAARQAALLGSNKAWNSVHKAVIKVFQGGSLQDNELYSLNENIRQLLKSELGPFITDYFQNHLLSKGLILMEEKMRVCEGENLLEALTRIWDHFFTEILPMLQAIFYPVQGQELTIRQMALLGFRDLVLLKANLEQVLHQPHTDVPPSITQMLLVLQGAHEPNGPTEKYIQLERLVQLVVSPYLGMYGLLPRDRSITNTAYFLVLKMCELQVVPAEASPPASDIQPQIPSSAAKRSLNLGIRASSFCRLLIQSMGFRCMCACHHDRRFAGPRSKMVDSLTDGSEVTASNETMLTPLIEQEGETYLEKCGSIRRHTVANAPTELQLLAMSSMLHPSLREEPDSEDKCLLTQPGLNHRHYSSELNIPEIESEFMNASLEETPDMKCTALG